VREDQGYHRRLDPDDVQASEQLKPGHDAILFNMLSVDSPDPFPCRISPEAYEYISREGRPLVCDNIDDFKEGWQEPLMKVDRGHGPIQFQC